MQPIFFVYHIYLKLSNKKLIKSSEIVTLVNVCTCVIVRVNLV